MKQVALLAALTIFSGAAVSTARAAIVVFDFESLTNGSYASVSQTVDGLTADVHPSGGTLDVTTVPFTGFGSHSLLNFPHGGAPTIANFSSLVGNVSITGMDFTPSDLDHLYLAAYSGLDGTGTFLGSVSGVGCCDFGSTPETISLSVSGVRSVTFFTDIHDPFPGSVYFDNLTVSTGVPEPYAWMLMIGGFGLAGAALRRRIPVAA